MSWEAAYMPKRKRPANKPEMLSRNVAISSFSASIRIGAVHRRGEEPEIESQPWLELQGKVTEPVRDVTDVKISMYPREPLAIGTARPASVGAIIQAKPELSVVLTWSNADFDRVWSLATTGHLKYTHLYFTKPHYNSGLVVSASFSSEMEE
jgi:hypothetical protein